VSDNLQRYLPEYDDDKERAKLAGFTRDELVDMLLYAYKSRRVLAKQSDEFYSKERRIKEILDEPSKLLAMPGVPSPDELRKMFGEDEQS
jgi:hypothetical protein